MMHITVIAVGKLKETFWKEACAEYMKRLRRYVNLDIVQLDDVDPDRNGGDAKARSIEAESITKRMPKEAFVIAMDINGRQYSSEEFAAFLDKKRMDSTKNVVFVIGGPTGLDDVVKQEADERISFGKLTLPHNLARVVLLEQLYRGMRILSGEPYHK